MAGWGSNNKLSEVLFGIDFYKSKAVSGIIVRYLNREIINTMLVITAVLLAIFICNQFVRYLGDAAMGRMTAQSEATH